MDLVEYVNQTAFVIVGTVGLPTNWIPQTVGAVAVACAIVLASAVALLVVLWTGCCGLCCRRTPNHLHTLEALNAAIRSLSKTVSNHSTEHAQVLPVLVNFKKYSSKRHFFLPCHTSCSQWKRSIFLYCVIINICVVVTLFALPGEICTWHTLALISNW